MFRLCNFAESENKIKVVIHDGNKNRESNFGLAMIVIIIQKIESNPTPVLKGDALIN